MTDNYISSVAEEKTQVNLRLTKTARDILERLQGITKLSQGDVVEVLLRVEAARHNLFPGKQLPNRTPWEDLL